MSSLPQHSNDNEGVDRDHGVNHELVSSLRVLWQTRQQETRGRASEMSTCGNDSRGEEEDDDDEEEEEEDYADEFWQDVQATIEEASRHYYEHDKSSQSKKKPKRKKKKPSIESSAFGLHTAIRLIIQLFEGNNEDSQQDVAFATALFSFALWKYQNYVDVRDPEGKLPIHWAVRGSSKSSSIHMISSLLEVYSEGAECTESNDTDNVDYPLQTALSNGFTWGEGGVKELVENGLETLVYADSSTGLYPYQMAASRPQADLNTIYRLLRTEPGVLQSEGDQEEDLGLLVLSMHECASDDEKSVVLMYLTSDDEESFTAEPLTNQMLDDKLATVDNSTSHDGDDEVEKIRVMCDQEFKNQALDASSSHSNASGSTKKHKKRRGGRRQRSFVSFDDQAKILEQASEVYQRRKESGFRDLGLLDHIDNCKETRAKLRTVGDPEALRKKKIADFIEEFRRKKPRGKQTHGLCEYEVKERLASLKKVRDSMRKDTKVEKDPSVSVIAEVKAKLRPADSSSPPGSPTKSPNGKIWKPRVKTSGMEFAPLNPMSLMFGGGSPKKDSAAKLGARGQYINAQNVPPPVNVSGKKAQSSPATVPTVDLSAPYEEEEEEGPLSPMQIQRKKLRSVQSRVKSPERPKPADEKESPSSKLPFVSLRKTHTKPRQYESSIKIVDSYERKKSTGSDDSTMQASSASIVEDDNMGLDSQPTSGTQEMVEVEPTLPPAGQARSEDTATSNTGPAPTTSTDAAPVGDGEPAKLPNSDVVTEGCIGQQIKSEEERVISSSVADPSQASDSDAGGVTKPSAEPPLSDMKDCQITQTTETTHIDNLFTEQTQSVVEMDSPADTYHLPSTEVVCVVEQTDAGEQAVGEALASTESVDNLQQSIPSSVTAREESPIQAHGNHEDSTPPRRRAQRRRSITADCVLRKRAEMEIRDQTLQAQKRLCKHQQGRLRASKRHASARKRREARHVAVCEKLLNAQSSVLGNAFEKGVYVSAIVDATEECAAMDEETLDVEADLIKQMHCMLALEKQDEITQQDFRKMTTYLRRCKAWLQDYNDIAKNLNDLEAQNDAMRALYESTVRRQEAVIDKSADPDQTSLGGGECFGGLTWLTNQS